MTPSPNHASDPEVAPQTNTGPFPARLRGYCALPVCPGLYAGRVSDRVKVGHSMNLTQRIDGFKFEEILGLKPFAMAAHRAEHPEDHAFRVKQALLQAERRILDRLAAYRIPRQRRANAHEWFTFNDEILRVLFADGWIVARGRVSGAPLGTRMGRSFWANSRSA
jgi:hypothetical protein